MAADFKSHVLRRDEKGLFGIPFKRLLLAGVTGGLTFTLFNLTLPTSAIPLGVVTTVGTLVLTGPRGGIPLWRRWIYRLRGSLLLLAAHHPESTLAQAVQALDLPTDLVYLDGELLFVPPAQALEVDLREWITFAHASETDGLVFVDAPMVTETVGQVVAVTQEGNP